MIEQARSEIRAGECIQVVLSQRFHAPLQSSPLGIYRALRLINPSPYTFFLKIGEETLLGSSPETMVKLEHGRSSLRPIAGTRPRGATPTRDRELADELLSDEKERAEHLMLVDLGRNDLGRTAVPASVPAPNTTAISSGAAMPSLMLRFFKAATNRPAETRDRTMQAR